MLDCHPIVADRLWVGRYFLPEDVDYLKSIGITTVINLQSDDDLRDYRIPMAEISDACRRAGIALLRFPIRDFDRAALASRLPECVEELEKALAQDKARVYLHCTAGINRSPTAAAAFLVKILGLSANEALNHVVRRRPCSPYTEVLEQYEVSLQGG